MGNPRTSAYQVLAAELPFGKKLPQARYIHTCGLSLLPEAYTDLLNTAAKIAGIAPGRFNVVKFELDSPRISLLSYPWFFELGFPLLANSWTVDLEAETSSTRSYDENGNPPVLHRKETLLPPDHPLHGQFRALTREAEEAGLLEDGKSIGRKNAWDAKLRRVGLAVRGNRLVDLDDDDQSIETQIARHRTALARYTLSSPMQQLWKLGYLNGENSVFDYGCGRGDDVRTLACQGIDATGWDPYFAKESPKRDADIVNLGFVLNVIEDRRERDDALRGAWSLAQKLLTVAVILGGRSVYERFRLFRDGVLTRRGTFQKYFAQAELREYIRNTLERDPIAIAPGIFFVFKADEAEQDFLAERQLVRSPYSPPRGAPRPRPKTRRVPKPSRWIAHRELIDAFWSRCLELGRIPEADEFSNSLELREKLGTPRTVLRYCISEFGEDRFAQAQEDRRADRLVYLALNLFERRRSLRKLPQGVQRDIKGIWGSHSSATADAKELLFSIGSADVVLEACQRAAARGLGFLEGQRSFYFHPSVVFQLEPALRVYLGCAARIIGDIDNVDLIRVHIGSKKVSLMRYDDFEGRAIPLLVERTKILLGRADYQVYEYGEEYAPQPLYMKSLYLPEDYPGASAQRAFDESLRSIDGVDFDGHGPELTELQAALQELGLEVRGFQLRSTAKSDRPSGRSAHGLPAGVGLAAQGTDQLSCALVPPYDRCELVTDEDGQRLNNGGESQMTILEAIVKVLNESDEPLSSLEIHASIEKRGLFDFKAKDPKGVISSTIGKHLRSSGPHRVERSEHGKFRAL